MTNVMERLMIALNIAHDAQLIRVGRLKDGLLQVARGDVKVRLDPKTGAWSGQQRQDAPGFAGWNFTGQGWVGLARHLGIDMTQAMACWAGDPPEAAGSEGMPTHMPTAQDSRAVADPCAPLDGGFGRGAVE